MGALLPSPPLPQQLCSSSGFVFLWVGLQLQLTQHSQHCLLPLPFMARVVTIPPIVLRQEIDESRAEQLESVPCGQTLQNKDYGRSKDKLSPAWIKEKQVTYFSFLGSKRPSELHMYRKVLRGQRREGAPAHRTSCQLPRDLVLESILAKRCTRTQTRALSQAKYGLKAR